MILGDLPDEPTALWQALADAFAAQRMAIAGAQWEHLETLLARSEQLIAHISRRDIAVDAAQCPTLPALARAAQEQQQATEAAFREAHATVAEQLRALQTQRTARQAFTRGALGYAADRTPRFFDRQH